MRRVSGLTIALLTVFSFQGNAAAQLYDFPFRAEDLRDDERVHWGHEQHLGAPTSVQSFGHDLNVLRKVGNAWVRARNGDESANENFFAYDRPVYAMRDGTVIACWRMAPENERLPNGQGRLHEEITKHPDDQSRIYGGGNHLWVEHDDGTRVEYAHFRPGTVPASLCPNRNRQLLPSLITTPDVTHAWPHIKLRIFDRRRVKAGQRIGRVGNSGTGSDPHLHIHVERGGAMTGDDAANRKPVQVSFRRGLSTPLAGNPDPFGSWRSFAGDPLPPGPRLIWPPRTVRPEHVQSGVPMRNFQAHFDHLSDSGYQPNWIDSNTVGGMGFINAIWHPRSRPWRAFAMIGEERFQDEVDLAIADELEPVFVDSTILNGARAYSVIFARNVPGSFKLRHKRTQAQHESLMNEARADGRVPVNVSVISIGGKREYTVLYRDGNAGDWRIRSRTELPDFQSLYDEQSAAGRKPLYLNAYRHDGKFFISAVFGRRNAAAFRDRHVMTPIELMLNSKQARQGGLRTRVITGFDGAEQFQDRFGALWWK